MIILTKEHSRNTSLHVSCRLFSTIRLVIIMVTWIPTLLKTFQFLAVIRITLDITIAEYAGIAKCRSASNACAAEVG